ncbi:hypothetical protein [Marinobacter zhanjiangensis]|uniref:Bacteriophage coat protein B n=1 Tax=Marinobacter zhanjiangensis TaxID=578215 RepID=A0ABQ3B8B5_9GAMM|nr:hypothetical protein [Marinobacter zhanjiangensis]GGY83583.1 hypothetical protein GCM10007071_33610 [Marinobacter zhanjiangensis]
MKKVTQIKSRLAAKAGIAAAAMAASSGAFAYDWSTVTGGIDLSGEETAVAAIVALLAGFFVVRKGGRLLLSMIK